MSGYFDHNATTPMCRPARDAWLRAQENHWHNPSSLYREAGEARRLLEDCRERLADLLGCEPECIVFLSGATEANHSLFAHAAEHRRFRGKRVLVSPFEHPSVREPARRLAGAEEIRVDRIECEIAAGGVGLVSVMAANNETGTIFPVADFAAQCRRHGVLFHSDAAQSLGKMTAAGLGQCDFVTGCAHKFGGPKGVGFLRLPSADDSFAGQFGGPQENRHRAGTEDYPAVEAMLAALEWAQDQPADQAPRDAFETVLGWPVVGAGQPRLWNTSMVIAPRHDNRLWLARLSQRGFQCSTGSACSSGKDGDSHVLAAMGLAPDEMKRVLRLSSGWESTEEDWNALTEALGAVLEDLDGRKANPKSESQNTKQKTENGKPENQK